MQFQVVTQDVGWVNFIFTVYKWFELAWNLFFFGYKLIIVTPGIMSYLKIIKHGRRRILGLLSPLFQRAIANYYYYYYVTI
jgi:hypothetical protein